LWTKLHQKYGSKRTSFLEENYAKYKATEAQMEQLGFREMSEEAYHTWVTSMQNERKKISE